MALEEESQVPTRPADITCQSKLYNRSSEANYSIMKLDTNLEKSPKILMNFEDQLCFYEDFIFN